MKAIRNLDCLRCAAPCPVRVATAAVATDHLRARVLPQPSREGVGSAIGEQFDRFTPLQVHQDGPITLAPGQGEIVHSKHPGGGPRVLPAATKLPQQRVRTDGHSQFASRAGAGLTAQHVADQPEHTCLVIRSARIPLDEAGKALRENVLRAIRAVTEPATGPQLQSDANRVPGLVSQRAVVATVDALRRLLASRTGRGGPSCGNDDNEALRL